MEKEHFSFALIAIVAIVAIVVLIVSFSGRVAVSPSSSSASSDLSGAATRIYASSAPCTDARDICYIGCEAMYGGSPSIAPGYYMCIEICDDAYQSCVRGRSLPASEAPYP